MFAYDAGQKPTISLTNFSKRGDLKLFLKYLNLLEIRELSSMHAVTSVMEYLAFRLVSCLALGAQENKELTTCVDYLGFAPRVPYPSIMDRPLSATIEPY